MVKKYEYLTALILKSASGEATEQEKAELQEWLNEDPENQRLIDNFHDEDWLIREYVERESINTEKAKQQLWARMAGEDEEKKDPEKRKDAGRAKINTWLFINWKWLAAAVVVGIIVSVTLIKVYNKAPVNNNNVPEISRQDSSSIPPAPGIPKAILTLANGERFVIQDTTVNGYITTQDNLVFSKKNGLIFCDEKQENAPGQRPLLFHTLETPKGGTYGLVLPDGSKVWLNSQSSIRFPSVFTGNERLIELEGEAYFEVVHEHQPFIAKANGADIKVTGTQFNVFAHAGNKIAKVTLIDGQLSVSSGERAVQVVPAQSAVFAKGIMPTVFNEPNMNKILAWRNNQFLFEGDSLTSALEEIARWYNLEIDYVDRPAIVLNYFIDRRNRPIDQLLENLTAGYPNVHIRRTGRTLFVHQ